jgi:hypothetical protein
VYDRTRAYIGVQIPVGSRPLGNSVLDDWESNFAVIREYERKTGKRFPGLGGTMMALRA